MTSPRRVVNRAEVVALFGNAVLVFPDGMLGATVMVGSLVGEPVAFASISVTAEVEININRKKSRCVSNIVLFLINIHTNTKNIMI